MYYTWMDIEWKLKSERRWWPACWDSIDAYTDELIIHYHKNTASMDAEETDCVNDSLNFLDEIFKGSLDKTGRTIKLQLPDKKIQILLEESGAGDVSKHRPLPLFKNAFYQESRDERKPLKAFKTPVVAFHSYKGGVGRTLSLIYAPA